MTWRVSYAGEGWLIQDADGRTLTDAVQALAVTRPVVFRREGAKGWAEVDGGALVIDADQQGTIT